MDIVRMTVDPADHRADPEASPISSTPRINIVATEGEGPIEVVLFAHLDTEAPTATTAPGRAPRAHPGRAHPGRAHPIGSRLVGTRLHGLGAADDKAGVVSIVAALRALRRSGHWPAGMCAAFVHAKSGGSGGSLPVWRALAERPMTPRACAIYCHPAETGEGLAQLKVASRGLASLRATVSGRTPPPREERTPASADIGSGVNAVELAATIIAATRRWARVEAPRGTRVAITAIDTPDRSPFEIPEHCEITIDLWFEHGTPSGHAASLAAFLRARTARSTWLAEHPVDVVLDGLRASPSRTDRRSALVRAATRSIADVTGRRPVAYAGHAASDIRFPALCAGIPAVGFGALGGGFYGPDEWVDLDSVEATSAALARTVLRLTSAAGAPRRRYATMSQLAPTTARPKAIPAAT
jgi:acetylornithine deacetylase/succinyl-diaminopimelate desuccinylase-like protein